MHKANDQIRHANPACTAQCTRNEHLVATGVACPPIKVSHLDTPIVTNDLSHVQVTYHRSIVSVIKQFHSPDESGDNYDTTAGYHAVTSGPRKCRELRGRICLDRSFPGRCHRMR